MWGKHIGDARAARILDELQEMGIVGLADGYAESQLLSGWKALIDLP